VEKILPLSRVRIVLIATSHPGNIGAAARAMKNMCLEKLVLVRPRLFPHEGATARASGADELLEKARCVDSLEEAVAGCRLVVGASARLRTIPWPLMTPRETAQKVVSHYDETDVALVFGREHSGLTNEELDLCHYLVNIPTNPEFSSLNLAMAVQLLAYEVLLASEDVSPASQQESLPAEVDKFEGFFQHLEQTLTDIDFSDPRKSDKLFRKLRRFFMRAAPDDEELNLLRGILSAAQGRKSMRRDETSKE
jgi:TrmH family RNA methyltransferase